MINLIKSYYNFLHLGMYLDFLLRKNKIAILKENLKIKTGANNFFKLNTEIINTLITKISSNPNYPNIFAYIVQFSSFKGIFTTTLEEINTNKNFEKLFKQILNNQFFDFLQIIKFIRNTIVHANSLDITLKKEDFEKQKKYLENIGKTNINLQIYYSQIMPSIWKGSPNYGFEIQVNFKKIKKGTKLLNLIKLHNLYLLAEFIYNITLIYEKINNKK